MIVNGLEPLGDFLHPTNRVLAGDVQAVTLINGALPVEWKVVEVFAGHDVDGQFVGGQAFDYTQGSRCHDGRMALVVFASILGADDFTAVKSGRIHFDLKGFFFANALPGIGVGFYFLRLDDFLFGKRLKICPSV